MSTFFSSRLSVYIYMNIYFLGADACHVLQHFEHFCLRKLHFKWPCHFVQVQILHIVYQLIWFSKPQNSIQLYSISNVKIIIKMLFEIILNGVIAWHSAGCQLPQTYVCVCARALMESLWRVCACGWMRVVLCGSVLQVSLVCVCHY